MIACNEDWVEYKPYGAGCMNWIFHKLRTSVGCKGIKLCRSMNFVRHLVAVFQKM